MKDDATAQVEVDEHAGEAAGGDGGRGRDVFVRPKHTCFNYGKC